jgi:oligoribonuclease (3'-5' exoribonuclease)
MADFYDYMIDIETTGTEPDVSGIIQIAAVKFNVKTQQIDSSSFFDRCLRLPPKRYWCEDTRAWWYGRNKSVLDTLIPRMEDPAVVMQDFHAWVMKDSDCDEPRRIWGKPTAFDAAFIESYMKQFQLENPFHFRFQCDVNTYIRGLANDPLAELEYRPFTGPKHNAIFDSLHQIGNLFEAINVHRPSSVLS